MHKFKYESRFIFYLYQKSFYFLSRSETKHDCVTVTNANQMSQNDYIIIYNFYVVNQMPCVF